MHHVRVCDGGGWSVMAYDQRSLDDYVDVATRIADFRAKYPDGCLQPLDTAEPFKVVIVNGTDRSGDLIGQTFIVYTAAAYRTADDPRPGVGCAWEIFPGRTPYTRGSELMNAETSAWGRAIIALGASDSKQGIASREEVRNRQAERETPASDGLSDAERDSAGMMTKGQRAAHTRMTNSDRPPRPADRGPVPDGENLWKDQPAGDWEPVSGEDQPGSSNSKQWQRLGILYTQIGISERDDRLADMRDRAGREIGSAKDLSYVEAQAVISALEPVAKAKTETG
jgi:hypothetical protein